MGLDYKKKYETLVFEVLIALQTSVVDENLIDDKVTDFMLDIGFFTSVASALDQLAPPQIISGLEDELRKTLMIVVKEKLLSDTVLSMDEFE